MKWLKCFEGYLEPEYHQVDHHTDLPPVVSMSDRTVEQIIKIMGAWKWSENIFICEKKPDRTRLMLSFQYGKPYDKIKYCKLTGIDIHSGMEKPISDKVNYINISQGEDDWFRIAYVGITENKHDPMTVILPSYKLQWFKCDQIEGLIKFLKDKDII